MTLPFRCAAASEQCRDVLAGSASTVRRFLLVEASGPWGREAVRDSRQTASFGAELVRRCAAAHVRPLLIRRHGRSEPRRTSVFAAAADPGEAWLGHTYVERTDDVLDLPLERLTTRPAPFAPAAGPLFLTCTHGRHDVCCAERGRPVAAALAGAFPEHSWEVSHIGGDRFAGNLLVLPDGLYYGRLEPAAAVAMAEEHLAGRLDLDHLRGRSGYPFAAQAAEAFLRRHTGLLAKDAVGLLACDRDQDMVAVRLEMADRRWRVRVRRETGDPRPLTCRATRSSPAVSFALVDIEPEG